MLVNGNYVLTEYVLNENDSIENFLVYSIAFSIPLPIIIVLLWIERIAIVL